MQSASLYHHIGSKDDLLYALCAEAVERTRQAAQEALAGEQDPLARVRRVIDAHVQTSLADQDAHATLLGELRSLPPERRQQVVDLRDEYEALITGVLADAQAAGRLRSDVSPRDLTLVLLSLLNWPIFWFRPDGRLTPEALADLLATVFLEGALAT
jgi:AcrR family transcriptional regulator